MVYRAGIGVPVLKMTASARAFQRCVARAFAVMAYVVMARRVMAWTTTDRDPQIDEHMQSSIDEIIHAMQVRPMQPWRM